MDFGSILHAAQENKYKAKQEQKKCYTTSFSAPKKEQKTSNALSANIQKFLARKEEEEKKKEDDAKKKRDELLALRSQDGKAKKRVAAMLKRTKAANKSAIEDAIDDDNTAVTINGPSQPDEDDYGYVSQEASAYYNKLMDKYNSAPVEEPLYSTKKKVIHKDLNSTKDRVRMALLKEEEEEMMPHKRRRRVKNKKEDDPGDVTTDYHSSDLRDLGQREAEFDSEDEVEKQPVKPKVKKPAAPPPINFQELLKLAEKKQFEPVKIEPKKKPEEEDHRPMTKKQKLEYQREQEWRQKKEEASKAARTTSNPTQTLKIPKLNSKDDSAQNSKSSQVDRGHERPSGSVQQMKIPKINSVKREEKSVSYYREEERSPSSLKKDERPFSGMKRGDNVGTPSPKIPRQNGSFNRENSNSVSVKTSNSSKDDRMLKRTPKDNDEIMKRRKLDGENSLIRKSQVHEDGERSKGNRNEQIHSSSNSVKNLPLKTSEGKQNSCNIIKNSSGSGYDKKMQEAIMTKMHEVQKKKKMEESVSAKSFGKPPGKDSTLRVPREVEKSGANSNIQGKMPGRLDRPVEQRQDRQIANQKQGNTNNNRQSQEWNSQNRPSAVPSTKPKVLPPEGKPKTVPSTSRPAVAGDVRSQVPMSKSSVYGKPAATTDGRKLMPPPKQIPQNARPRPLAPSDSRPRPLAPSDSRPRPLAPSDSRPRPIAPSDSRPRPIAPSDSRPRPLAPSDSRPRPLAPSDSRPRPLAPSDSRPRPLASSDSRPKQVPPAEMKSKQFPPADMKPKQFPPTDMKPKQFPPADMKPKQFPPADLRPKQFPPSDVRRRPKLPLKRRITDSEEEYDSEMDDFIDDGPEEEEDYSQHIREIFGYDRRKYSRIDDDDECMESNFATILKEDFISTKTGILEDLEDIRREKEMERKKKLAKKRKL